MFFFFFLKRWIKVHFHLLTSITFKGGNFSNQSSYFNNKKVVSFTVRSKPHWLHLRRQMPVLKSSLSAKLACKPWTEKHSQPQDDVILWLWVKKMQPCLDLQCNMVRMALSVNPFPHYHYSLHTFFSPLIHFLCTSHSFSLSNTICPFSLFIITTFLPLRVFSIPRFHTFTHILSLFLTLSGNCINYRKWGPVSMERITLSCCE